MCSIYKNDRIIFLTNEFFFTIILTPCSLKQYAYQCCNESSNRPVTSQVESFQTRVASRVELLQVLIKSSGLKSVVKLESSRVSSSMSSLVKSEIFAGSSRKSTLSRIKRIQRCCLFQCYTTVTLKILPSRVRVVFQFSFRTILRDMKN